MILIKGEKRRSSGFCELAIKDLCWQNLENLTKILPSLSLKSSGMVAHTTFEVLSTYNVLHSDLIRASNNCSDLSIDLLEVIGCWYNWFECFLLSYIYWWMPSFCCKYFFRIITCYTQYRNKNFFWSWGYYFQGGIFTEINYTGYFLVSILLILSTKSHLRCNEMLNFNFLREDLYNVCWVTKNFTV